MRYRANPVEVEAFQITRVREADPFGNVGLECSEHNAFIAHPGHMARMTPKVGDYWVIQSDGYMYLNPKEVFERKYSQITE